MQLKHTILGIALLAGSLTAGAQYEFKNEKRIDITNVKSQDKTGTCWSYSTASFIESELMRMGKGVHDLSEMYAVRNIYRQKALNYVLRQGKANFSQGALAHDYINAMANHGLVPQQFYSGLIGEDSIHNHTEMEKVLSGVVEALTNTRHLSDRWDEAVDGVLDAYLGEVPTSFSYEGSEYTPSSFVDHLGIDPKDYVSVTSFTHHPFHESFVLEIPDNFSNGSFYNVPLDELVQVIDEALANGYTIAWDGDVSEKTFKAREGLALLPEDPKRDDLYEVPGPEVEVTQALRQAAFMSLSTTDDHLMHLIGTASDKEGNKYYIIKNSWGEVGPYDGIIYMSEAYLKMKTVGILLHKSAVQQLSN